MNVNRICEFIDRFVVGARVSTDVEAAAQYATLVTAYVINLIIMFAAIGGAASLLGTFDLFRLPLEQPNGPTIFAAANLITLLLMYAASQTWSLDPRSTHHLRSHYRTSISYRMFVGLVAAVSLVVTLAAFFSTAYAVIILNVGFNPLLLLLLVHTRALAR